MIQVAYVVCRGFFAGRLVYLEHVLHDTRIIFKKLFYGSILWLFPSLRCQIASWHKLK